MRFFSCLFIASLLIINISCSPDNVSSSKISKADLNGVVLVGGSLISSMEEHPFFEMDLNYSFPHESVSLRNIGWPADDVFGLARSQFGSAQNTQSWEPPTKEKGFGSKVLKEHIEETKAKVLIIGYGPETAFYESDDEYELFESGYLRLLEFAMKSSGKVILITPPKQEPSARSAERNEKLERTSFFIKNVSDSLSLPLIDLNEKLITDASIQRYTTNGVQLNKEGYRRMSDVMMEELGLNKQNKFSITIREDGKLGDLLNCQASEWAETVNGFRFKLQPNSLTTKGEIISDEPMAIIIDGQLQDKSLDTTNQVTLSYDSIQNERLLKTIKEKNQLYRYRLRPLNEAYIYLFRKHEMGHLAYEMDDLLELVREKEIEIEQLKGSKEYYVELETIKPWTPPKNYADDEVPNFIPEPNIEAELQAFRISDGLEINLFAKDPMIANPININWDLHGRAWIASSSTYPHIVPGREPNDKIIILEDTDSDGVADKHTVFAENLLVPHSVMPVEGGAYVVATTQLLFLEDLDGDDVADKQHVIFDGFGNADVHHTIHGLRWMPWGDLHFTQSIYINSFVETVNGPRILNGSGVWSFRPDERSLEIFSRGMINPWGETVDQWGQSFATDGAHSTGVSYIFPESAHASAVGEASILSGLDQGTPKNTGAEIVYSSHFPQEWQGSVITSDFRANRTVRYQLEPYKSFYKSKEVQTILSSEHRAYRPVDGKIGPDGALYIVDWYNPIVDHGEVDFHHPVRDKTHGRIWRLTNKNSKVLVVEDLQSFSTSQLFTRLKSDEQVTRIRANRALVEKNISKEEVVNWVNSLKRSGKNYARSYLEGLWLLAAINEYDEGLLRKGLSASNYHVRAASTRLIAHYKKQKDFLSVLKKLIIDNHPQVRLESLHALREMGGFEAAQLAIRVTDLNMDSNLDFALSKTLRLLYDDWIEGLGENKTIFNNDDDRLMYALLAKESEKSLPFIDELLGKGSVVDSLERKAWQMIAKIGDASAKEKVLAKAVDEEDLELLKLMARAPKEMDAVPGNVNLLKRLIEHDSTAFKLQGLSLAGRWEAEDLEEAIMTCAAEDEALNVKVAALRAIHKISGEQKLISLARTNEDEKVQAAATAVWLENDVSGATDDAVSFLIKVRDPETGALIFSTFRRQENGPKLLEKALESKSLTEEIASAGLQVVQTSGLNLQDLEKVIREAGNIKAVGAQLTSEDKAELIASVEKDGNVGRGRGIYRRKEMMCGSCHQVDKEGGLSGPHLGKIGTFMTPESILESLINPSAAIKQNYETVVVTKKTGEVLNGILHRKTDKAILLRQANSQIVEIPSSEISNTDVSPNSMMPPGLTANLHKDELKDLLAYLMSLGK